MAYFVHMVATIFWVGGIALLTLVLWPAARRILGPGLATGEFMSEVLRRFSPLALLSIAALIVTGLMQMTANPHYEGLLKVTSPWSQAILLKHVAFGVMVIAGSYLIWGLQPALSRLEFLEARGQPTPEIDRLRRRQKRLHLFNLVCGVLVLAFTAVARVA